MKDFDALRAKRAAETDREFRLGGETFRYRPSVRPEVLNGLLEIQNAPDSADSLALIDRIDALVLDMIEDDGHAQWKALRERNSDPIGLPDLVDLVEWLVEAQTGRVPTQQPSPSTAGLAATGTPSTGASSSRASRAA